MEKFKSGSYLAIVQDYIDVVPGKVFILNFHLPGIGLGWAKPGQFITLPCLAPGSKMRRPFSIFSQSEDLVSVMISIVGKNTELYSRLRAGDMLEITGPHGNEIPVNPETKYLLVAGNVGYAALHYLAKLISVKSFLEKKSNLKEILIGSKEKEFFNFFETSTSAFSLPFRFIHESKGLVTDALAKKLKKDKTSTVVVCGPLPMLKKVTEMCITNDNSCTVVLEQTMACGGKGSCLGDVVYLINGTPQQICKHGPSFNARAIDWGRLLPEYRPVIKIDPLVVKILHISSDQYTPYKTILLGQNGRQLHLSFPYVNGAGCLNYPEVSAGLTDIEHLGMLVTKGVSLKPWPGNPAPRVCEVPYGMLNSIGLQNDGVKNFVSFHLSEWESLDKEKPLCINICGETITEFKQVANELYEADINILDLNIGCPNVKKGGIIFGLKPKLAAQVMRAVRKAAPHAFIFVKPTPNTDLPNLINVIRACKDEGADALILANSRLGMAIDVNTLRSKIAKGIAGLTGPAILPQTVALVFLVAKANLGLPIVASGGASDWQGAIQLFAAGANVVGFGTEFLSNGKVATEVHIGVARYMTEKGILHIQDIVGKAELPIS